MSIQTWARGVYWWWFFRFLAGFAAIALYQSTYHPHGFVAAWGVGIAIGILTAFALDACRSGYRREKRLRDEERAREARR